MGLVAGLHGFAGSRAASAWLRPVLIRVGRFASFLRRASAIVFLWLRHRPSGRVARIRTVIGGFGDRSPNRWTTTLRRVLAPASISSQARIFQLLPAPPLPRKTAYGTFYSVRAPEMHWGSGIIAGGKKKGRSLATLPFCPQVCTQDSCLRRNDNQEAYSPILRKPSL